MTRVLITGGAGFIGSHLAETLLERGDDVLVIDNMSTATADNLRHDLVTLVEGTIADRLTVDETFDSFGPDVVVHAAASYKDPAAWEEDALTNVVGTANVVQAAERAGVQRLIYLQTALCYGLHPETQPIGLDHPLRPFESSYAISKTAAEGYVRLSAVPSYCFRLANVYGPRNVSGPLPTFYQRITAGKPCFVMDTRRDFVFVDDAVALFAMAVAGEGRPGVYHASSGSDHAIRELYDATRAALGLEPDPDVEVRPRGADDAFSILLDPTLTNEVFGWHTRTPLAEGVARAVAWYREHDVRETYTHLKVPDIRG